MFNLTLKEEEYHKELLEPIESDYQSMTSQVRKRKTSPQAKGKHLNSVKGQRFQFSKKSCVYSLLMRLIMLEFLIFSGHTECKKLIEIVHNYNVTIT